MSRFDTQEIPEHVRRIIDRDGRIEFTPPSFERWLGRLQMLRTIAAMGGFISVWLMSYDSGQAWDAATVRAIIAAVVFHFVAWAAALFVFGELYDGEVKRARVELEEKERERASRIESYYRERLRAQESDGGEVSPVPVGAVPSLDPSMGMTQPLRSVPSPQQQPSSRRAAA